MKYTPVDKIIVKARSHLTLPIDRLVEFQGNLKRLTQRNREKLMSSILEKGFIAPIFVWDDAGEYRLLDGHQRLKTLLWMRENGWDIPMIPVDIIEADDEQDAKKKLLAITSQYGEFDLDGFIEFTSDIEIDDTIRLTSDEWNIDEEDKTSGARGGHYNDEEAPEIDPRKGMHRIEACAFLKKRETAIELFAGRGALSFWYRRLFKTLITNDAQEFDDVAHDYTMKADRFILENITSDTKFDLIDFDDEGCPAKEIQVFFDKIKCRKEPFILAITDGNGLNLKSRGKINFRKTYMIRSDETVQAKADDYDNFNEIFREFIENVTIGWKYDELSLFRKDNGNVIYATYYVYR